MKAISFPFSIDQLGKIEVTTDQRKIYLDRVMTLLSTIVGQRAMRPTYGNDVPRGVYESGGDYSEGVVTAIRTAFTRWLPLVAIQDILITEPGEDGTSQVTLSVTLPDLTEATVSLDSIYLFPDGSTSR